MSERNQIIINGKEIHNDEDKNKMFMKTISFGQIKGFKKTMKN